MKALKIILELFFWALVCTLFLVLIWGCEKKEVKPMIEGTYKLENENFWITFDNGIIEGNSLINKYQGTYNLNGSLDIRIGGTKILEKNGFNNVRDLNLVYDFDRYGNTLILLTPENEFKFNDISKSNKIY